jgi:hypothetical protein
MTDTTMTLDELFENLDVEAECVSDELYNQMKAVLTEIADHGSAFFYASDQTLICDVALYAAWHVLQANKVDEAFVRGLIGHIKQIARNGMWSMPDKIKLSPETDACLNAILDVCAKFDFPH